MSEDAQREAASAASPVQETAPVGASVGADRPSLPLLSQILAQDSPQATLIQQLSKHWEWINEMRIQPHTSQLRATISNVREKVQGTLEAAQGLRADVEGGVKRIQQPSETLQRCWSKVLDFRRQYPGAVVAFIAAASVLPGLSRRAGPRVLLRNCVIGGGTTCVLLYPEFVMRTAPYVMKTANRLEQRVVR